MERKESDKNAPLILIVDDDESMRHSLTRLVHSFGFGVVAFASAGEFLDSGKAQLGACLILDLRMPGMDGLQLQHHLTETQCDIPIIFLSAQSDEEERRKATKGGSVAFLHKPASEGTLTDAIRMALRRNGKRSAPLT